MKRFLPVLGALVLVAAVVAVVVWQRSDAAPPSTASGAVVLQYADGSQLWRTGDPETPVVKQVVQELGGKALVSLDQLRTGGGAIVVTTIDPRAQSGAVDVIRTAAAGEPASLRYSITAVDPNNGAVKAYAPGNDPAVDYAGGVLKEPGPAFFPFNVVAALQSGKTLDSTYDGRSPRTFGEVTISDSANCGERCTVRDALRKSGSVAMYDLVTNDVGIMPVVTAARQAGVPESVHVDGKKTSLLVGEGGGTPNADMALGEKEARMRPLDLAAAYSAFASEGTQRVAHFITHVTDVNGATLYRAVNPAKPAFDQDPARSKDIASQINAALQDGEACSNYPDTRCRHGEWRPKGLDQTTVAHAWMVGYSPQMSVAVFVGGDRPTTPAVDSQGRAVVGSGLPKALWRAFEQKLTQW
ncbi:penicillin binding protein [Lentzea atacamensis]|uniref:Penicillin binding protein n=1 Tax=Lentzea atacamensis TaxID=531938 RepID=A0A316ICH8_9PSEU|nr:penicillin-binding transpeptidase domain-containing protein [Lentzea atacamensis]PWK91287.1 penicillin binding protein [Lentzea atacamensis]